MKILYLLMIAMMILTTGCGDQNQKGGDSNSNAKKLIVGFDENFPPFGFKDQNGEFVGFDIDLAKATMKEMGREVEFKPIDWDTKEDDLSAGRIDMIWNGLEITDDREKSMLFSKPYMYSGFIVFVCHSENSKDIKNKDQLAGFTVGIQSGSTVEMYVEHDVALKSNVKEIKFYKENNEIFKEMLEGKVDALIADETYGNYYIIQNHLEDKIDALNLTIGAKGKIAIGFRKQDIKLFTEVQTAFDKILKDGTAEKISDKWFGKNLLIKN